MSLEAALEEERLEILKLLERPAKKPTHKHASGAYSTPSSPRQAYSSVIPPLHHIRTSSPNRSATISSLIDIADPGPRTTQITWSPTVTQNGNGRHRSDSGPSTNGAPKLLKDRNKPETTNNGLTPNEAYNFSMIPSVAPPSQKRGPHSRDPSVAPSARGSLGRRSLSPGTDEFLRSASPRSSSGRLTSTSPATGRNKVVLETGPKIDLDHAYARLNDDALAHSGGVLGKLPERRPLTGSDGEHIRAGTGESITSEGGVRLQKDYEGEHVAADSSDEDSSSLDSPGSEEEERRGRGRAPSHGSNGKVRDEENDDEERGFIKSMIRSVGDPGGGAKKKGKKGGGIDAKKGTAPPRRATMSLLAAAEEERLLPQPALSMNFE